MYSTLLVTEPEKGIRLLTLSRPHVLNAINTEMIEELKDFYLSLKSKKGINAVVLTGAGDKAFCSGADLKVRNGMSDSELKSQHELLEELNFIALECEIPFIAAVNGYAFGGGVEIALLCDFIFCSLNASFALPEVKVGLMPGFGGTQRMTRRIGIARAKELIFTGSSISATTALEWGLVNRILPLDSLISESIKVALTISENAPISIHKAKFAIDTGYSLNLKEALKLETDCYNQVVSTSDRLEGIRAFNEKRPPVFEGK